MSEAQPHFITKPKRQLYVKFLLLCLLLAAYVGYLSYEYNFVTGGIAALITWSFFVLCTPIADAGFLLDFPLRLLFGIRMVFSEIAVWLLAISVNLAALYFAPHYYETTAITQIFHSILTQPYPYWSVIILSAAGTFLSIRIGDELMDVLHHKDRHLLHKHGYKHELLIMVSLFALIAIGYYEVLASLGMDSLF